MKRRHFDNTENAELRAKIDEAKQRLPTPALMRQLGFPDKHIGKEALCPFHDDHKPSFSVFQSKQGKGWQWKCQAGCGYGDEITFLVKHFDISRREAINRYLQMAGFPARRLRRSHEYRQSPAAPASPSLAVPVSEGHRVELQTKLKELATENACREPSTAKERRWKLARDLRAVEKQAGRKLTAPELMMAFDEWYCLSQPFLDPTKSRHDHLATFLAQFPKIRVPTGEGALSEALESVSKLSLDELPTIPGNPNAPEHWRRLVALHRELSRRCSDGIYFLSYRDAAKVSDRLTHQQAHDITYSLETLGVIEIYDKGQASPSGGKAAEFVYLSARNTVPSVPPNREGGQTEETDAEEEGIQL
jgi:hypothetical protein